MKETKIEKNENKINKRKRSDTLATKEESNKKIWKICTKAKSKDRHTHRQTDIQTNNKTDRQQI